MAKIKVLVKEVSLIHSGEMMAWVFKNCASYSHAETFRGATDMEQHYYILYFTDPRDVTLFTLKWL